MIPTSAALVLLLSTSACSLVFDGDDFLFADASIPDARTYPDVDPSGIALMSIEPAAIDEGSGCVPAEEGCGEGSRPVPVVLSGVSISERATVTLSGGGFDGEVEAVVSDAGDRIAFALSAPVRPDLAAGAEETITVTVSQDGFEAQQMLTLRGLDELSLPAACAGDPPACDAAALSGRYSRVEVTGDFRATGDEPLILEATAEIVLGGVITADGSAPASMNAGGVPGPGGCAGGAHSVPASCGEGSGGGSGQDGGGGGGGNGSMGGGGGGGASGGQGGAAAGPPTLTPLADSGGRGGGGGGPAAGLLGSSNGGAGGGGGGVVLLRTGGRLHVATGGGVSAAGGDGQAGSNANCGSVGNGYTGGGGGGSGGAIFLGAALALVDEGEGAARLSAPGGAAGPGPGNCLPGGDGGDGLVRVDAPVDGALPAIADSAPDAYRGPILAPTLPAVTTEGRLTVELYGAVGATYYLQVDTADPIAVDTGAGNRASAEVELEPGISRVCAKVGAEVSPANQEGIQCHTVVYVPRSSP